MHPTVTELPTAGYELVVRCTAAPHYHAIIAIHSSALGPAVGGIRRWAYASEAEALRDALRLARGMSYKSAIAGLSFGGGKSVILDPGPGCDRSELYRMHGRAIEALGGKYVGAEDVGTSEADVAMAGTQTRHVAGLSGGGGDPSPFTARGLLRAIQAAAFARWGAADLAGRSVSLQGCGNVGGALADLLVAAGARLIAADSDAARAQAVADRCGAQLVPAATIATVRADIFAPCALGGILNDQSIAELNAEIVCGAANNQLAEPRNADGIAARGILYIPDYVANAGGIISGAFDLMGWSREEVARRIDGIYDTVLSVLREAAEAGVTPAAAADRMAERLLGG